MGQNSTAVKPTNAMAITSLIASVLGWLFAIIFMCLNFGVLPIFTLATLGVGLLLYCIVLPFSCIIPLGWVIGIIAGHVGLNQMRDTGEGGEGLAKGGLFSGYVGLGLLALMICVILGFLLFTGSIPLLIGLENL